MSRDRVKRDERLNRIAQLRFIEGLTESQIQGRLAAEGQQVSRSTISRDISRARSRFEEEVGTRFNPRAVLGQAVAQFDHVIFESLRSGDTASNSAKAALYRVGIAAIEAKLRILQETGLIDRAALVVRVQSQEKPLTGAELAAILREAHVSDSELVSPAERARRYGELSTRENLTR